MIIHVVSAGQTLSGIAAAYGVSVARLVSDNGILDPNTLVEGQALVIQRPTATYTVRPGDTLGSIAATTGVPALTLVQNNPALVSGRLVAGETLALAFEGEKEGTLALTGYAYPFIDREVLAHALPYLTYLTIFGYGFTTEGDLIPVDDDALITIARRFGVGPVMLLSTVTESGTFSTERASLMLRNSAVQARLIEQIVAKMREKAMSGWILTLNSSNQTCARHILTLSSK